MPPTDPTKRPANSAGNRDAESHRRAAERGPSPTPEKVDFGAFVSSHVRSSADRLKRGTDTTSSSSTRPPSSDAGSGHAGNPLAASRSDSEPAPSSSRNRPRRYWRDAVTGEENVAPEESDGGRSVVLSDRGGGNDGGNPRTPADWFRENSANKPWFIPALIAAGVVVLLLLIFLMTRLGGGGGGNVRPTVTSESVIESSSGRATPPPSPTAIAGPTPTETPRTGGDNQRRTQPAGAGTPGAVGAVSQTCPEQCLVRVSDHEPVTRLMKVLGTRSSFAGSGWQWLVATPEAIAKIERIDPGVVLVDDTPDTLRLYAVKVPSDVSDETAVNEFGAVLDTIDALRIVQVESVPARVGPLTDSGYVVSKLTPAPPKKTPAAGDKPALASTDIGTLTPNVSADKIAATIEKMQAMGATDGSAVGSRYYSLTGNQLAAEYLFQQLEATGARVWYEDFVTPDGLLLVNVIGELPGKDESKIYGMMAHFDTTATIPSVSPGADDNATGVAATLEIMRVLSGYQLTHPMRAIFTNAEDSGLLGSDAWAKRAVKEKTPIEGVFNVDSVGSSRRGEMLILNSDQKSAWMSDIMERVNDAYGMGQSIDALQSSAIVADDNYVRGQGIESIMIARELYKESQYHHTANDLIEHVSIPVTVSATQVVLLSVASLVQ